MTERPDAGDEEVRRLLAAAAEPSPVMPEEVAARLDHVLAGLVSEREVVATEVAGGDVVPLDPRRGPRRARRWPRYLVAAAAVSVLGVGIGSVVQPGGPDTANESSSAGGADQDTRSAEDGVPESLAGKDGRVEALEVGAPVPLRSAFLSEDVESAVEQAATGTGAEEGQPWRGACVRPATSTGDQWLPATLDGRDAVLVLRRPVSGRRTADVYTCDNAAAPAATTTVPTR